MKSAEQSLSHLKIAPGKLDNIKRQLAMSDKHLKEDMPSAVVVIIQNALFDLMDLEEEIMKKELEFELVYGIALDGVKGLFAAVRANRMVKVETNQTDLEVNLWTNGRYGLLEKNILELKKRLENNKHIPPTID